METTGYMQVNSPPQQPEPNQIDVLHQRTDVVQGIIDHEIRYRLNEIERVLGLNSPPSLPFWAQNQTVRGVR